MTRISVHSELHYDVGTRCAFTFGVLAARTAHQQVVEETIEVSAGVDFQRVDLGRDSFEVLRLVADAGPFSLTYDAVVDLQPLVADGWDIAEVPFERLPADVLTFLNPSRYCESDRLVRVANATFGHLLPGFARVVGVCNWVYDHLDYVPGSTDASSTATDVLVEGAGVCRDYAHLAIAMCRALGIPARYLSGYAVDLGPPDFHGFMEVYLDGRWYLFDATRMVPLEGLVRIAHGHDAADASFATFVGGAELESKVISVIDLERLDTADGTNVAAVSTA
jgi:transglutaminase-like putative cysteine protease